MFLLDTNVLSELRKANTDRCNSNVQRWFSTQKASDLYLSSIVIFEIEKGILQLARKDTLQAQHLHTWLYEYVLPSFENRILPLNTKIALACAKLHIPNPKPERDAFISATALVHEFTLVTRNIKDFENTGVKLLNPWDLQE